MNRTIFVASARKSGVEMLVRIALLGAMILIGLPVNNAAALAPKSPSNLPVFAPPTNDDVSTPDVISAIPFILSDVDTTQATLADSDPQVQACNDDQGLATVWYTFTPATDVTLYVDTLGSSYDTFIAVWTGTSPSLTPVACNDDYNTSTVYQSKVEFAATAGTQYYIEIAQYHGAYIATADQKPPADIGAQDGGVLQFHVYDATAMPSVISITRVNTTPTRAATVNYTVTFSEPVINVDTLDFKVTPTGITGAYVASVTGTGTTYTVAVNTGSGSGTLRLDIPAFVTITDPEGNGLYNPLFNGQVYTIDRTPPTVVSIVRASPNPTSALKVNFTVTFSEAVNGIGMADFVITRSGSLSSANISAITGSGKTRTVTVNLGVGNGTVRLDLPSAAVIYDAVGNKVANLPYTSGQTYTVKKALSFISIASQDGWILETGENTNLGGVIDTTASTLRVGDDTSKRQFRSILSFNTSALPDTAVITSVTLKVKKYSVIGGTDPITLFQGFMVDIRRGSFGLAGLERSDFQATANGTYGPFTPTLVNTWYTLNLTTGKTYINKTTTSGGLTQIRLRFKLDDNNNTLANFLALMSGNSGTTTYRPVLTVLYYVP